MAVSGINSKKGKKEEKRARTTGNVEWNSDPGGFFLRLC